MTERGASNEDGASGGQYSCVEDGGDATNFETKKLLREDHGDDMVHLNLLTCLCLIVLGRKSVERAILSRYGPETINTKFDQHHLWNTEDAQRIRSTNQVGLTIKANNRMSPLAEEVGVVKRRSLLHRLSYIF